MNLGENKEKETRLECMFRFMAMSKFIGVIAFGFVFMITIFSMVEMHETKTYAALPQLIVSAFAFATVYAGFYLLMAKVEHVEEEKTRREKELAFLNNVKAPVEEIVSKQTEIQNLSKEISEILK